MDVNEDFIDIAKGFIDNGVEFLVVGAYALAAHGLGVSTGSTAKAYRHPHFDFGSVVR